MPRIFLILNKQIRKPLVLVTLSALTLYCATLKQVGNQETSKDNPNYIFFSDDGRVRHVTNRTPSRREETTPQLGEGRVRSSNERELSVHSLNFSSHLQRDQRNFIASVPPIKVQLDKIRRHLPLWPKDPECECFRVRFAKFKTFPKCGLTSYPGSGNTWLRSLIEGASGIFTGSVYNDGQLYLGGHYGEFEPWSSGTTIAQKSHAFSRNSVKQFGGRGIVLIRNPYRAIMAYHNYLFAGHHLYAPISNYRRKDWPSFAHLQGKHWLETFINWVNEGSKIHVVHYESLRQNPAKELRKILKFLRVPVEEDRLRCIQKHMYKNFRRKEQRFADSLVIFRNETRDKLDRAIRYATYLLKKYGHEPPPTEFYEFYNGTSSDKIIFVPCVKEETTIECDARVDEINMKIGMEADRNKFISSNRIF